MVKVGSFCRWIFLTGIVCGLTVLPIGNCAARAELITFSFDVDGTIIAFPPPSSGTPTAATYSTAELTTLNTLLTGAGSAYTFQSLGGSSNWSGAPGGGVLSLSGIVTVGSTGSTSLSVTESELGFNSPSGLPGTLSSSSSATFNDAGTGNSQSADSYIGSSTTPLITLSSSASTGPNSPNPGPPGTAYVSSLGTSYGLNNYIAFSLSTSTPGANDAFGVSAKVTAVPEPASVVTMLIGLPLPLVGLAWFAAAARLCRIPDLRPAPCLRAGNRARVRPAVVR